MQRLSIVFHGNQNLNAYKFIKKAGQDQTPNGKTDQGQEQKRPN